MALPDASTKLRMVLDYLPCEACLAQPVDDQDLLCSLCARLDRQVAVRVGTRTTILLEKPSAPEAPIVIPAVPGTASPSQAAGPPAPAPAPEPAPAPLAEVVVRFVDDAPIEKPGVIEVVVEPLAPPAPVPLPPPAAPVPLPEPEPEPAFDVDDIATFTKARDEFFDYRQVEARRPEPLPPPLPPPSVEPAPLFAKPAEEPAPEDDFVFRPPPQEEPARVFVEEPVVRDDIIPEEEVPVESTREEQEKWAPPPDFLAEEEPAAQPEPEPTPPPQQIEEGIIEMDVVEDEPLEMELVPEEDEVVEMEMVAEDEPEPPTSGTGDLWRLRGFDAAAAAALGKQRIQEIAHLSGHDAGELSERSGLPQGKLIPWIQVADLVHDVGVPVDAAIALVAAGVAGPKGLRDADPDEIADRATAFGGHAVQAKDVKRWKRRA